MAEAIDLFCITKESVNFEGRDVSADHVKIPSPRARPISNIEGVREDYFIFLEDGRTVLLEVASRSPFVLSRVDLKTLRGIEIRNYLCNLGGDVARLLTG
jgi:hypothetical protein